jgi:hypothetical protein
MTAKKSRMQGGKGPIHSVVSIKTPNGEVQWRVTSLGKVRRIKTSKSSARAMDETTRTYSTALARLADR